MSNRRLGRRRQAQRASVLCEALEPRRLLSVPYASQPYVWTSVGIGGTGTVYYANVNPLNTNEIYAETDIGETWHTTNGGLNWTTLNFALQLGSDAQEDFVQYTNNPDIQYAVNVYYEPKVTTDDGTTWTTLSGWSSISAHGNPTAIWADPNNSSDLILTQDILSGTNWNSWISFSSNGGQTFSTIWSNTSGTNPDKSWAAGAFWDPNGNNFYFATDDGLFTSTNSGANWTQATLSGIGTGQDLYSFAGSDQGGVTRLWATTWVSTAFTSDPSVLSFANLFGGLYTSTTAGASWTNMDGTLWAQTSGVQLYPHTVQMIDNDINDIWIGGEDTSSVSPIVYHSSNVGSTWSRMLFTGADTTYFTSDGPYVTSVAVVNGGTGYSSSSPPTVTFSAPTGSYNGVQTTATGTAVVNSSGVVTSVTITNAGSGYTSDPTVTIAPPTSGTTATATAQDHEAPNQNVYTRTYGQGSEQFGWGYVGLTVTYLIDRSNSNFQAFTVAGTLFESTDGGANWYDISGGGPAELPSSAWTPEGQNINPTASFPTSSLNETSIWDMTFVSPTTIFSDDTDVAFQRSTNNGADWNFPAFPGTDVNTFYQTVYDPINGLMYGVTSNKHNLYAAYLDDGEVEGANDGDNFLVVSSDQGETWSIVHAFPSEAAARTLALDPNNPNIMYVGTANHLNGGIWHTTDLQDGVNSVWTRLGDGINAAATATMDVTSGLITNGGSGYTVAPTVTLSGGGGSGAAVSVSIANGAVITDTLTNAGSGYTSAPSVTFSAPTSGVTATGVAIFDGNTGVVSKVYITNGGSGYTAAPTISFSGGGGSNAAATTTIGNGAIDAITITTPGSGYTSSPTMTFSSGNAAAVAGLSISSITLTNGGSLYPSTPAVFFDPDAFNNTPATATVTLGTGTNSGTVASLTFAASNGGSDYTTAPAIFISSAGASQPERNGSFSAMHPQQIIVLNNGDIVAVMAPREENVGGAVTPNAGIWLSTNGGTSWIDTALNANDPSDTLQYWTTSITIDPNDPTQATWFATVYAQGKNPVNQTNGDIYETTNYGATWNIYSTVGSGYRVWIQPGGTMMLLATREGGIYYTPNYKAATPVFYQDQSFPFAAVTNIISNPFDSNQIWVTTYGNGMYETDLSQVGLAATVQNVSVATMDSTEAMVSWTVEAPLPTSYLIQTSTNGGTTWSNAATVANYQDSSYLVTGLTPATEYDFQVISVDSAGNSPASAIVSSRTEAAPALIAYDGFADTTGAGLSGQSGGSGWAGAWTAATNATIVSSSWDPTGGPNNTGNSVQITGTTSASRTLSTTVGNTGTVVWASFDESVANGGSLLFGNSTNGFGFGTPVYENYADFYTITNGTPTYYEDGNSISTTVGHFMVVRLDFESTYTLVELFVDPTPGETYPDASSMITKWVVNPSDLSTSTWTPVATGVVTLTAPTAGTAKYDEVRIGNTYADVAPLSGVATPAAPTGITTSLPTSPTDIDYSPNEIDLSWTNNATNQQGFFVQESTNDSTWTTLEKIVNQTATSGQQLSYSVTNLNPATAYYFRVASFNAAGSSSYDTTSNSTTTLPTPPAAVTNLAATVSSGNFNLTWSDVSGATGYQLEYANGSILRNPADDGGLTWTTVSLGSGVSSYAATGLLTNALYYFRIYPSNTGGYSTASNVVSQTAYAGPTSVTATGIGSGQIAVTWTDSVTSMTGFNVQYSSNGVNWTSAGSTPEGNNAFTITGLTADTQYYVQVQAYATGSTGVWSSSAVGRTFSTGTIPTAYEGFDYLAGNSMNGQTGGVGWTGAWTAGTNASVVSGSLVDNNSTVANNLLTTGNKLSSTEDGSITRTLASTIGGSSGDVVWASVLVQDNDTAAWGSVDLLGTGGNNNFEFGFPYQNDYSFVYTGEGQWSSGTAPTKGNTELLVAEMVWGSTNTTMSLWVDPNPTSSSPGTALLTETTSHVFPTIYGVTLVGSTYDSAVNYWDELRVGTSYNSVVPLIVPAKPGTLSATGNTSTIGLSWGASTGNDVQGYDVWRSTDGVNFGSAPYASVSASSTTYTDSSVASGTTYYYEVSSYDTTGDSIYSNIASATIGGTIPAAPSNLVATPGTSSIALTWQDNSNNETAFNIQRSTDDSTWTTIFSTGANVTAWTDTTLVSGTPYYYQVNASNGSGGSAYTGMPNYVATVIAYEGFNYGSVTAWNGGNTGVGFSSGWTVTTSSSSIVSNLTYSNSGHALTTSGNAAKLVGYTTDSDTLGQSVGTAGTTVWVGFEFSTYQTSTGQSIAAELDLGPSTNKLEMGAPYNGEIDARVVQGTSNFYLNSTTSVVANTTYFVAYQIQYLSTGDVINLYIDPTPGTTPTTAAGKLTLSSTAALAVTNALDIYGDGEYSNPTFDEIRLGASYDSVAPDPLVGSSGHSDNSPKHRPSHVNRTSPFLASVAIRKHTKSSDVITQTAKNIAPAFYSGSTWRLVNDDADNNTLFIATSNDANWSWQGLFN